MQKILLTGVVNDNEAVSIFNQQLISEFIVKNSLEMRAQIIDSVKRQNDIYFSHESTLLLNTINLDKDSILITQEFYQFFSYFCQENNIVEWYLVDSHGSFLLLTADGKLSILAIKPANQFESDYQIAMEHDASKDIIDSLEKRKKMLFLLSEEELTYPVSAWDSYLFSNVSCFDFNPDYYYVHIDNLEIYNLEQQKITFYNEYLKQQADS